MMNSRLPLLLLLLYLGIAVPWVQAAAAESREVRIGILNYQSEEVLGEKWQTFEDLLNQRLPAYRFKVLLFDNNALDHMVASRSIDFVLTTSSNYLKLHHLYGLTSPLVTIARNHQGEPLRAYGGAIFVRNERKDISELKDVLEQRVATIGTAGFAGYQVQAHALLEATGKFLEPEQLIITGQPQGKVVEAVLSGQADVGFVRSGMLETLASKGKIDMSEVRVLNAQTLPGYPYLSSTVLYPEWPFAAMPHTDHALTNRVAGLLLTLNKGKGPATKHIYGFDVPSDYLATVKVLQALRAPPFDAPPKVSVVDIWSQYKYYSVGIIVFAGLLMAAIVVYARLNHALTSARDVLEIQRNRLSNILSGTGAGTWEWDIPSGRVQFNSRWAQMTGYDPDELKSMSIDEWGEYIHPQDRGRSREALEKLFEHQLDAYECEIRVKHKGGHWMWILSRGKVARWSSGGEPLLMSGTYIDISDKKKSEQELERIATTDMLTGLLNRRALFDRLEDVLSMQHRHGGLLAIVYLDLDGFKPINDNYGHDVGDKLLLQIGRRFKTNVRQEDIVARIGGDEFVVVLYGRDQADAYRHQVERLLDAIAEPVNLDGLELAVTASAGITLYPQGEEADMHELFRQADDAMYRAKQSETSRLSFAENVMQEGDLDRYPSLSSS